jgi:hypothetical protein
MVFVRALFGESGYAFSSSPRSWRLFADTIRIKDIIMVIGRKGSTWTFRFHRFRWLFEEGFLDFGPLRSGPLKLVVDSGRAATGPGGATHGSD